MNDFCSSVNNGYERNKSSVFVKKSGRSISLILFLLKKGFINGFQVRPGGIIIFLRYYNNGDRVLPHLTLVSKGKKVVVIKKGFRSKGALSKKNLICFVSGGGWKLLRVGETLNFSGEVVVKF